MNMRYLLASLLLAFNLFAATPPQSVDLDLSQTTRNFSLKWAEGTTPLIRANLRNAGAAYTATGWTGTLYLQSTWDDTQVQAIASTATGATYLDFQLTGAQTATSGVFFANFIATDGTATVEWQRGTVEVRDSPGTSGAGSVTLTSPLTWSSYTFTGTAAAGPYRAGNNVTFSALAGGAVAINSADTLGALTPTAGRLIYGNGSAWTVLAPGTAGQVLAMGASLPAWASAGAGDITAVTAGTGLFGGGASGDVTLSLANTAVTAGSYGPATITVDAQGRLTAAATSSSAAIQAALGAYYVPLAGNVNITGPIGFLDDVSAIGEVSSTGGFTGPGSGLTGLPAGQLTGDIPAAAFGGVRIDVPSTSFTFGPHEQTGWTDYTLATGSNAIAIPCVKSAAAAEQDFIIRSAPVSVPRGFVTFNATDAINIEWVADSTTLADIRGLRLVKYSGGTATVLYSDTTTRNVGTVNTIANILISSEDFTVETIAEGDDLVVEITGTVEQSKCLAIFRCAIKSE